MLKQNKAMPISPHLAIYKMQLTSALSIMHRATGIFLFIGLLLILWWVIFCISHYDVRAFHIIDLQSGAVLKHSLADNIIFQYASAPFGQIGMALWSYCLFYHALAGVRHLVWDMGKGFDLLTSAISGWVVVFGSIMLTIACWVYALA